MKEPNFPQWSASFSFKIEADEKAADFFRRLEEQHKAFHEAVSARLDALFGEFINVDAECDENVRNMLRSIFAVGYQCGWNDYKDINQTS